MAYADGTVEWKYQSPSPLIAGVTTTAGNLVLTGDLNGDVLAFDAPDGRQLWKHGTGSPAGGGVITYLAGGKQYVAVAAGITSKSWQTSGSNAKVVPSAPLKRVRAPGIASHVKRHGDRPSSTARYSPRARCACVGGSRVRPDVARREQVNPRLFGQRRT